MGKYLDEAGLRKVAGIRNGDKEELKGDIQTNRREVDGAIAAANDKMTQQGARLDARIDSVSADLANLQGRFETQAQTVGRISDDLDTAEKDIDSLESRLSRLGFKKAKDFVCDATDGSRLTVSNYGGDMRNFRVTGGSLGLYRLGNLVVLNGVVNVAWDSGKPLAFKLELFDGPNHSLVVGGSGDLDYKDRAEGWGVAIKDRYSASDPAVSPFGGTSADMIGSVNWDGNTAYVYRLLIEPQPGEQMHAPGMGGPAQWAPANFLLMTPAMPRSSIYSGSAQIQIRNCCWANQHGLPGAEEVSFN